MNTVKKLHLAMTADGKGVEEAAKRVESRIARLKASMDSVGSSLRAGATALLGTQALGGAIRAVEASFKKIEDAQKRFLEQAKASGRNDMFVARVQDAADAFQSMRGAADSLWLRLGNDLAPTVKAMANDVERMKGKGKGDGFGVAEDVLSGYLFLKKYWNTWWNETSTFSKIFSGIGAIEVIGRHALRPSSKDKAADMIASHESGLVNSYRSQAAAVEVLTNAVDSLNAARERQKAIGEALAAQQKRDEAMQDAVMGQRQQFMMRLQELDSARQRRALLDNEFALHALKLVKEFDQSRADVGGAGAEQLGSREEFSSRQRAIRAAEGRNQDWQGKLQSMLNEMKREVSQQTEAGKKIVEGMKKLGLVN